MYVDASHVYQGFGKGAMVRQALEGFQKVPELGAALSIGHETEGRAVVAALPVRRCR